MKRFLRKYLYFLLFIPILLIFLHISDINFNFQSKKDTCALYFSNNMQYGEAIERLGIKGGTDIKRFCEYYKK